MPNEHGWSVLLIDDSTDDAFFFRRAFEKAGLTGRIEVAENGRHAIDCLERAAREGTDRLPDVVFVDLKMPEVDGFEVLAWIRANYAAPPFAVVVLTASDQPEDRGRAAQLGAHAYYVKPMRETELASVLAHLPSRSLGRENG